MSASDRSSTSSGGRSRQSTTRSRQQEDGERVAFNPGYRTQAPRPPLQQYYIAGQNVQQNRASQNGSRDRDTVFQPTYSTQRSGWPQPQGPQTSASGQRQTFSRQADSRRSNPDQYRSQQPAQRQPNPPRPSDPSPNVSSGTNGSSGGGAPSSEAINSFLRERQRGPGGPGDEPWAMISSFKYEKK